VVFVKNGFFYKKNPLVVHFGTKAKNEEELWLTFGQTFHF